MAEYYEGYPKQAGLYNCYIETETDDIEMVLRFWIDEMSPKKRGWRDPETFELLDEETNYIMWNDEPVDDGGGDAGAGGMQVIFTRGQGGIITASETLEAVYAAVLAGVSVSGLYNMGTAQSPSYAVYQACSAYDGAVQFASLYGDEEERDIYIIDYSTTGISASTYVLTSSPA